MQRIDRLLGSLFSRDRPAQITLGNFVALGLAFMTAPVIARAIGPEGRGETAAVLAACVFVPVLLGLGVPLELRRRSAEGVDEASVRRARDLVLASFLPSPAIAFLFTSTAFTTSDAMLEQVALLSVALAPVTLSWSLDVATLVGAGRYRAVMVVRIMQPALVLATTPALWIAGHLTPVSVLLVSILSNLATALLSFWLVGVGVVGPRASMRDLLRDGLRYSGSAIAEAASARIDQVLVLPLIGAAEAGYYSVAASLAVLPLALGHAVGAHGFRAVILCETEEERRRVVAKSISGAVSVVVPSCLGLWLACIWLVPLLFGSDFGHSVTLLAILLPGSVAMVVGYVGSMLLGGLGRGGSMAVSQALSLGFAIALLFLMAPSLLGIGASVASTGGYLLLCGIQFWWLRAPLRAMFPSWSGWKSGLAALKG